MQPVLSLCAANSWQGLRGNERGPPARASPAVRAKAVHPSCLLCSRITGALPTEGACWQELSSEQRRASEQQIFNLNEAFERLSRELGDLLRNPVPGVAVQAAGDDVYLWAVKLTFPSTCQLGQVRSWPRAAQPLATRLLEARLTRWPELTGLHTEPSAGRRLRQTDTVCVWATERLPAGPGACPACCARCQAVGTRCRVGRACLCRTWRGWQTRR